jgi:hypothetical protein
MDSAWTRNQIGFAQHLWLVQDGKQHSGRCWTWSVTPTPPRRPELSGYQITSLPLPSSRQKSQCSGIFWKQGLRERSQPQVTVVPKPWLWISEHVQIPGCIPGPWSPKTFGISLDGKMPSQKKRGDLDPLHKADRSRSLL